MDDLVQRSKAIWGEFFLYAQIIARETANALLLVLGLGLMNWLLHRDWLALAEDHTKLIEAAHFWLSYGLMILMPVRAILQLWKK